MANFNFWSTNTSSTGLSGMSGLLSDYSSIRNGSYGKLLKSYYGLDNNSSSTTTSKTGSKYTVEKMLEERRNPTVSKEVSEANSTLSQSFTNIRSSIGALQKDATYEDTSGGQTAQDKVVSAVKNFADDYNELVTSAKKSTDSRLTSNASSMMKSTAANKDALAEIGVTLNQDGTVSVNEKKLKAADVSKVQELFSSKDMLSYGSTLAARAVGASSYTSATKTTDSTKTQQETSASSTSLEDDSRKLASADLYKKVKVTGSDGKETEQYDVDAITSKAKSFVENYNKMVSSAKYSTNSGVASNLKSIQTKTKDNESALNELGISLNKDGSLSMDEDKFKNSDMSKVQKAFQNYGASVATNASLVNYYMTTQADATNGYASNGAYNVAAAVASGYTSSI